MKYIKLYESFINSEGELQNFDFDSDVHVDDEGKLQNLGYVKAADENGVDFTVYDIDYDDEGEDISHLPTTMVINVPLHLIEDGFDITYYLGEKITEETGFTHYSYMIKRD